MKITFKMDYVGAVQGGLPDITYRIVYSSADQNGAVRLDITDPENVTANIPELSGVVRIYAEATLPDDSKRRDPVTWKVDMTEEVAPQIPAEDEPYGVPKIIAPVIFEKDGKRYVAEPENA